MESKDKKKGGVDNPHRLKAGTRGVLRQERETDTS